MCTHTQVTDVVRVTEGGFGCLEAVVEGLDTYRGYKVRVLAKNENYLVRRMRSHSGDGGEADSEGVVVACTPDLICIVDSETGMMNIHTCLYVSECSPSSQILPHDPYKHASSLPLSHSRLSHHNRVGPLRSPSGCPRPPSQPAAPDTPGHGGCRASCIWHR